jgi:PiT family inorganic phosphate transporter
MLPLLGGIFLGWSLGANDASNVFGPAVAARMVKFRTATILAAIFVILGALLEGRGGIETLKGLTPLTLEQAVICSIGAAATVTIMTLLALPVSTSQAVVGAILGIGLMSQELNTAGLGKVLVCWFGTPVAALVVAILLYTVVAVVYNGLKINLLQSDRLLRFSLIAAVSYGAYAMGANNVANVTAVFVGAGKLSLFSAVLIGGLSIALGILTFSRRVMETVGIRLVSLDSFSGLIVILAEGITIHIFTVIGVPVSTSQAVNGAVLGIGVVNGINTVRKRTLANILVGWFLTPVVASFITICIEFTRHLRYVPGQ